MPDWVVASIPLKWLWFQGRPTRWNHGPGRANSPVAGRFSQASFRCSIALEGCIRGGPLGSQGPQFPAAGYIAGVRVTRLYEDARRAAFFVALVLQNDSRMETDSPLCGDASRQMTDQGEG